jgi:hypothetical protein
LGITTKPLVRAVFCLTGHVLSFTIQGRLILPLGAEMAGQIADREEAELLVELITRNFPWGKVPLDVFLYLQDFPREIRGAVVLINQGMVLEPPQFESGIQFASHDQEKWVFDFVRREFPRDMLFRRRVLQIMEEGKEVPRILPTLFCRWTKRSNLRIHLTAWEKLFGDFLKDPNFNEYNFPLPENRMVGEVRQMIIEMAMTGPQIMAGLEKARLSPCDLGSGGTFLKNNPRAQRDRTLLIMTKWSHPRLKVVLVPVFGMDASRSAVSLRPFESKFASGCAVLCEEPPNT